MTSSAPPAPTRRACLFLVLAALVPASASLAAPPEHGVASESLAITGAVKDKLVLKLADLQAFPAQVTQAAAMHADGKEVASSVRGVPLTALLDRAALAGADRNDWKHAVVVATYVFRQCPAKPRQAATAIASR